MINRPKRPKPQRYLLVNYLRYVSPTLPGMLLPSTPFAINYSRQNLAPTCTQYRQNEFHSTHPATNSAPSTSDGRSRATPPTLFPVVRCCCCCRGRDAYWIDWGDSKLRPRDLIVFVRTARGEKGQWRWLAIGNNSFGYATRTGDIRARTCCVSIRARRVKLSQSLRFDEPCMTVLKPNEHPIKIQQKSITIKYM